MKLMPGIVIQIKLNNLSQPYHYFIAPYFSKLANNIKELLSESGIYFTWNALKSTLQLFPNQLTKILIISAYFKHKNGDWW